MMASTIVDAGRVTLICPSSTTFPWTTRPKSASTRMSPFTWKPLSCVCSASSVKPSMIGRKSFGSGGPYRASDPETLWTGVSGDGGMVPRRAKMIRGSDAVAPTVGGTVIASGVVSA